jgi:Na+/citrate or Na+/malate symporter
MILLLIPAFAALVAASAWGLMLTVGVLHHDWWTVIPTMSYNTAILVVVISMASASLTYLAAEVVKAVLS